MVDFVVGRVWGGRPAGGRGGGPAALWILAGVAGAALLSGCGPVVAGPGDPQEPAERPGAGGAAATAAPRSEAPTPAYDPAGYDPAPGRGFVPLDDPGFVAGAAAGHLDPDEFVLGVVWNGEARAYPVGMMAYHHIANDEVRGAPILVTY